VGKCPRRDTALPNKPKKKKRASAPRFDEANISLKQFGTAIGITLDLLKQGTGTSGVLWNGYNIFKG